MRAKSVTGATPLLHPTEQRRSAKSVTGATSLLHPAEQRRSAPKATSALVFDTGRPQPRVATAPPETRGLARDAVRMLVASATDGLVHRRAYHLPAALRPGDLVVINTSDTLPAALRGVTAGGDLVHVHLSTPDPSAGVEPAAVLRSTDARWVVEVRRHSARMGGEPSFENRTGSEIHLAGGGRLEISGSYPVAGTEKSRLWVGQLTTPAAVRDWLTDYGQPIRYGYVTVPWPLAAYRNTYADTPGSVEMPSAGRPLTARTFRRLRARGIRTSAVLLHCGVSSGEAGEPPYAEWYSVPESTVRAVAQTQAEGGRVIAVGTTVVRALETVAATGQLAGWTNLVITPGRPLSTVDGLLTGWHEPEASHLDLLRAVAGIGLLRASYQAALDEGYRWHEFGDVHLILP
jgi:S-adenosylmethionine:tRNA ribosyltransferase-isomerase